MNNVSQDYFTGPDAHPGRITNSRVQAINAEIEKQRQYLPQFKGPHFANGRNSSQRNFHQDRESNSTPFDGSNFSGAPMNQGYAVVARHHAQSMISPQNFRDNMAQLHEQQRIQMQYMDQQAAYSSNGFGKVRNSRLIKHSLAEGEMVDAASMPSSLGILRNVARLNRPDMGQLDREYRMRTEYMMNNTGAGKSRGEQYSFDNSPGMAEHLRSTQKSSSMNMTGGKKARRDFMSNLYPIDKMAFDLERGAVDDVQKFMTEQFEQNNQLKTPIERKQNRRLLKGFNQKQNSELVNDKKRAKILSGGQKDRNHVRIKDNDPVYATPVPKKNRMTYDNSDIYAGNPKTSLGQVQMMNRTAQNFSQDLGKDKQYVNYINGVPVAELSPQINVRKKKFSQNQRLPKIQKIMTADNRTTPKAQVSNFKVRNSMMVGSNKRNSASQFHTHGVGTGGQSSIKQESYWQKVDARDSHRLRTHDEIVNDLENQFGYTVEENKQAMQRFKEEQEYRKKYATRKDKDLVARNIAYIKTLSESHKNIKEISKSRLGNTRNSVDSLQGLNSKDKLRMKSLMKDKKILDHNKTYSLSQRRRVSPRKNRVSKKDIEKARDSGAESQINILIPHNDQNGSQPRIARVSNDLGKSSPRSFQQNLSQFNQNQSMSPRKGKKVKISDFRVESRQSLKQSQKSIGVGRSSGQDGSSVGSRSKSRSPSKSSKKRGVPRSSSQYVGFGPKPQPRRKKHKPNNLYDFDPRFYHKKNSKPNLMQVEVDEEDLKHLKMDDVDEVSRLEITYKILKEQLREHQKALIAKKDELVNAEGNKQLKDMKGKPLKSTVDLHRFARHIKHFELYGTQRDVNPEIKRIVKNLMCQEHKFMYCPKCKAYDQLEVDPVENIQKFMRFVKEEQSKLELAKRKKSALKRRKKMGKGKALPDDSASDITDLEEEGILNKYFEERMTVAERKARDRKIVQHRLYGEKDGVQKHICSTTHNRPASVKIQHKVRMELREIEDPVSMYDESNSAHQFSLQDQSVQADSEARQDMAMQTSAIDKRSQGWQYSRQDMHSQGNQCSDIDYQSNQMNTSVYPPNCGKDHIGLQTDPRNKLRTPVKKQKGIQTVNAKDAYRDDWEKSKVYRKALQVEAQKRGIAFVDPCSESDDNIDDENPEDQSSMHMEKNRQSEIAKPNPALKKYLIGEQGSQTDSRTVTTSPDKKEMSSALGFLKSYREKGGIKQLTETEVQYVKRLLKQKNHEYWKDQSILNDLHRHLKYTIRKLTQQMAMIDNYGVFKHLKDPTREHTLYLVYRAERLQAAYADSQKIFKLLSATIYDGNEVQSIMDNKSFSMEDVSFLKKRDTMFKRIMAQSDGFLESYKLFNDKFTFKKMPLRDYLQIMAERTKKALEHIQDLRKKNPDLAAKEDERFKQDQVKKHEENIKLRTQIGITQLNRDLKGESHDQNATYKSNPNILISPTNAGARGPPPTNKKISKEQGMELKITNRRQEADYVGRETIDLINREADSSMLSNKNKTDRNVHFDKKSDPGHPDKERVKSGLAKTAKSPDMQGNLMSGPLPGTTTNRSKKSLQL